MLDSDRFHPSLAKARHLISKHSSVYYMRDPRDDSLTYGLVNDLPEPYRSQMRKMDSDFSQNFLALMKYLSSKTETSTAKPSRKSDADEMRRFYNRVFRDMDPELRRFTDGFGWDRIRDPLR